MNPEIMKALGYGQEAKDVADGNCPFCKQPIHPNKDFRDKLSRKEFEISGLCQKCQDETFGKGEE